MGRSMAPCPPPASGMGKRKSRGANSYELRGANSGAGADQVEVPSK